MAFLLVVSGPNEGDFHPLGPERITIGRNEDCTVQILDAEVSRYHMHVSHQPPRGYRAIDAESANGVFVNDKRIEEEVPLVNSDIIRIGSSELIFSEQDFIDRDTALEHYRRRTEHDRGTVMH